MTSDSRTPPRRVRIFSANLLEGKADTAALADLLAEFAPDVAVFQEFSPKHAQALRDALPQGQVPLEHTPNMAIALKHPGGISPVSDSPGDIHAVRLEHEAWDLPAPLEVVVAHIRAPHLMPPWKTFPTRRAQVRAITRHIEATPDLARVVVGDLNATPLWPAYSRLTRWLEDAALVTAQRVGSKLEPTWAPRREGPRRLRLDHALVRGVHVRGFQVLHVPGSDHRAVLVDIELPTPES